MYGPGVTQSAAGCAEGRVYWWYATRGRCRECGSVRRGIGTQHASIHILIATDPNGLLKGEGVLGGELATEDL